jgi:hypothetical protein
MVGVIPVQAAAQIDPKVANVVASDLPAGSSLTAGYSTIAALAARQQTTAAILTKAGIKEGYESVFVPKPSTGIVQGDVLTVLFDNATNAAAWFKFSARQHITTDRPTLFSTGLSGVQSVGLTSSSKVKGVNLTREAIIFAQGPYVVYVIIFVLPSQTAAETIKLAGVVHGRILSQLL